MVQAERLTTENPPEARKTGLARRRRRRSTVTSRGPRWRVLLVFLAPAFALYSVFIIYPLFNAAGYSLFEWRGTLRTDFVGVQNYVELFGKDGLLNAFWHNCVFFVGVMLIQNTAGLAFAVFLQTLRRGKRFFQTVFTLPYMVSPIVVGYLWTLMLSPSFGVVNDVLESIGLDALAVAWLGRPDTALPVVILVKAWQWVGFPMLLFGAALAGIPGEYAESARVDGAGSWRVFRHITFPLLLPAMGIVGILTFIDAFNIFDLVYALEGELGSPAGATDVIGLFFYRIAFRSTNLNAIGLSSALAVVLFVFIFSISIVANKVLRSKEARLQ